MSRMVFDILIGFLGILGPRTIDFTKGFEPLTKDSCLSAGNPETNYTLLPEFYAQVDYG
jgi:hypothetical protein